QLGPGARLDRHHLDLGRGRLGALHQNSLGPATGPFLIIASRQERANRLGFSVTVRRLLPLAVVLAFGPLTPEPADASKTRLRLERLEPSDDGLKVYASIIELEGQVVDDRPAAAFDLKVNGKKIGHPTKLQRFQMSGDPLDLVLIVES